MKKTTFEDVYARQRGPVFDLAARIVGDSHEAEDVAQETFLRLLRQSDGAGDAAPTAAWVRAIARNMAIDRVRHRARRTPTTNDVDTLPATNPSVDDECILPALVAAAEQLPRVLGVTMLLHSIDRMGHREISSLTRTTPGNVKVRLHRARSLLRRRAPAPYARCR